MRMGHISIGKCLALERSETDDTHLDHTDGKENPHVLACDRAGWIL